MILFILCLDNMNQKSQIICRDCQKAGAALGNRCAFCHSPRILDHDELFDLEIAHIDCDAFFASVEKRDNPDLMDKPVIIGGGRRGVVSTACYLARIKGVRSAMPMFKALKLCPQAVVIKPNMSKYSEAGRTIRERMRELTPQLEPISIDEAFLDLSGTFRVHGRSPAETLVRFANSIETDIGVSVSIGLSHNKFLAKVASDFKKPRGFSIIGKKETLAFLEDKSISLIWGVGKVTQKKLELAGYHTIGDIRAADPVVLVRTLGNIGIRLSKLSRGEDSRDVSPSTGAKSVSSETTFNNDLSTPQDLLPPLRRLCEKVSSRLKKAGLAGQTINLKMKSADFKSRTRSKSLGSPTQLADVLFDCATALMKKELDGTKFRLIGIGVNEICSDQFADPVDLVDINGQKRARAERAIDGLRNKFGDNAVNLGLIHRQKPVGKS
ncbi:MAG: DNA polymerase IV [Cohaesibacteraceae bacterium]|nr:DNA polymerase IV [Cohaesibacteraceae bacterium]